MKKLLALGVPALLLVACGNDEPETTTMNDDMAMSETGTSGMNNTGMTNSGMNNQNMSGSSTGSGMNDQQPISVTIEGVNSGEGSVLLGLQTRDQFATLNVSGAQTFDATGSSLNVLLVDYPSEPFAIAAFQDTNGNGTLDMNNGTPTEPYGFSGDSQKGNAPTFGPARVNTSAENVTVRLVK